MSKVCFGNKPSLWNVHAFLLGTLAPISMRTTMKDRLQTKALQVALASTGQLRTNLSSLSTGMKLKNQEEKKKKKESGVNRNRDTHTHREREITCFGNSQLALGLKLFLLPYTSID